MRKIIVISMITLDGVLQAPGAPEEDTAGNFAYGGWTAPYEDSVLRDVLREEMQPSDLLLGRKTFAIWETYWPYHEKMWPGINECTKYVVSSTLTSSTWQHCNFLPDIAAIQKLRESDGSDLHVWGSGALIQTLFSHDFVDELWLKIYPVTLGQGKKLFADGTIPAAFSLTKSTATSSGVVVANYKRAGDVQTGTVGGS